MDLKQQPMNQVEFLYQSTPLTAFEKYSSTIVGLKNIYIKKGILQVQFSIFIRTAQKLHEQQHLLYYVDQNFFFEILRNQKQWNDNHVAFLNMNQPSYVDSIEPSLFHSMLVLVKPLHCSSLQYPCSFGILKFTSMVLIISQW